MLLLRIFLVVKNILKLASLVDRDGRSVQQNLDVLSIIRGWDAHIWNYRLLALRRLSSRPSRCPVLGATADVVQGGGWRLPPGMRLWSSTRLWGRQDVSGRLDPFSQ